MSWFAHFCTFWYFISIFRNMEYFMVQICDWEMEPRQSRDVLVLALKWYKYIKTGFAPLIRGLDKSWFSFIFVAFIYHGELEMKNATYFPWMEISQRLDIDGTLSSWCLDVFVNWVLWITIHHFLKQFSKAE